MSQQPQSPDGGTVKGTSIRCRSDAIISPCENYRYRLVRDWDSQTTGYVNWIMLNPSTADAKVDDPTIRRCVGFTRRWGYGGIVVTNLFALRSTSPVALYGHSDPVGSDNDHHIRLAALGAVHVILAWGQHGKLKRRDREVTEQLNRLDVPCRTLRLTKDGQPCHPLYLPSHLEHFAMPKS